jgi:hypothetical protein
MSCLITWPDAFLLAGLIATVWCNLYASGDRIVEDLDKRQPRPHRTRRA